MALSLYSKGEHIFRLNFIVLLLILTGCTASNVSNVEPNICTTGWYKQVDKLIVTGDGQGHGPDLGSTEWRSVVEFKLGIRDDNNLPSKGSNQWCSYINNTYIKSATLKR